MFTLRIPPQPLQVSTLLPPQVEQPPARQPLQSVHAIWPVPMQQGH